MDFLNIFKQDNDEGKIVPVEAIENLPADVTIFTTFNYGWGLVRSGSKQDVEEGLKVLWGLYKHHPPLSRECLFYLSIGNLKLGNYAEARKFILTLRREEPSNSQFEALNDLIEQRVRDEGVTGMAIVGGAAAVAVAFLRTDLDKLRHAETRGSHAQVVNTKMKPRSRQSGGIGTSKAKGNARGEQVEMKEQSFVSSSASSPLNPTDPPLPATGSQGDSESMRKPLTQGANKSETTELSMNAPPPDGAGGKYVGWKPTKSRRNVLADLREVAGELEERGEGAIDSIDPATETPVRGASVLRPLTRKEMVAVKEEMMRALSTIGADGVIVGNDITTGSPPMPTETGGAFPIYPTDLHAFLGIIREEQRIYDTVLAELVRQCAVTMIERGQLLAEVRRRYAGMFRRIPVHVRNMHAELQAQRKLSTRLAEELRRAREAARDLARGVELVRAHDAEVAQRAGEAAQRLVRAVTAAEGADEVVREYRALYAMQRRRLETALGKAERDRAVWMDAATALAVRAGEEHGVEDLVRLQHEEEGRLRCAAKMAVLVAQTNARDVELVADQVGKWKRQLMGLSQRVVEEDKAGVEALAAVSKAMQAVLRGLEVNDPNIILGNVNVNTAAVASSAAHHPLLEVFYVRDARTAGEHLADWLDACSRIASRFTSEAYLALREDLLSARRLSDGWLESANRLLNRNAASTNAARYSTMKETLTRGGRDVDRWCDKLAARLAGEDGVASAAVALQNQLEDRVAAYHAREGDLGLAEQERSALRESLRTWSQLVKALRDTLSNTTETEQAKIPSRIDSWLNRVQDQLSTDADARHEENSRLHSSAVTWMVGLLVNIRGSDGESTAEQEKSSPSSSSKPNENVSSDSKKRATGSSTSSPNTKTIPPTSTLPSVSRGTPQASRSRSDSTPVPKKEFGHHPQPDERRWEREYHQLRHELTVFTGNLMQDAGPIEMQADDGRDLRELAQTLFCTPELTAMLGYKSVNVCFVQALWLDYLLRRTMMKPKQLDLSDSNIAGLGTDLEKKVRLSAAETEAQWRGVGEAVELRVWRIVNFKVVPVDPSHYGQFFTGDSYIVLNTWKEPSAPKLYHDIHFFLGLETTQDEAGTAAYKTVELDDCKLIITWYSLNDGDVFVLDNGKVIYQWNGKHSNGIERVTAAGFCRYLDGERGGAEVKVIDQGDRDGARFWELLGVPASSVQDVRIKPAIDSDYVRRMYKKLKKEGLHGPLGI
ncbi:hypothetical protein HDU93_007357 [Gonapodya sp. JEL0774]|nr:hypothetical protein HDU93_007357 [Gonapodya sp. JEL0774]